MDNQTVHFNNIRSKIITYLKTATTEIQIAVAWFTDKEIISQLEILCSKGVKIYIVFYDDKINKKDLFERLYNLGSEIRLSKKMMHNKFCIIDRKIIINGSYNWTYNASKNNNENIQITTENEKLAEIFIEEFYDLLLSSNEINSYFKNSKYKIEIKEDLLSDYLYDINLPTKFPYFYNLKQLEIDTFIKKNYLKEGFYLINNENEQNNFFRLIYYLNDSFNLNIVEDVTSKKFIIPTFVKCIVDYKNSNETFIPIKKSKYVIEIHYRFNSYLKYFEIDGSNVKEEIEFHHILPNGNYLQNFSNSPSKIFTSNLKLIEFNYYHIKIVNSIGIVCYEKNNPEGFHSSANLFDFDGNLLIKTECYNFSYDEIKDELIFYEYCIAKCFNSEEINNYVLQNFSLTNFLTDPHKRYIYDKKTNKLISDNTIFNSNINEVYFFLSNLNEKKIDLYTYLIKNGRNLINYTSFLKIEQDYVNRTKFIKDLNQKKTIMKLILDDCLNTQNFTKPRYSRIEKDKCYVATLAYQDINHPKVIYLRNYRDSIIVKYKVGVIFIKAYYKFSPKLVSVLGNKKLTNFILRKVINLIIIITKIVTKNS